MINGLDLLRSMTLPGHKATLVSGDNLWPVIYAGTQFFNCARVGGFYLPKSKEWARVLNSLILNCYMLWLESKAAD